MTTTATRAKAAAQPQAAAEPAPAPKPAAAVGGAAIGQATDAVEQVAKAAQDATAKGYEKAVALTKEQVEQVTKAQTAAFKAYEDAIASSKASLEAVTRASQVLTRGLQDIGKTVIGLSQESFEENVAASKQILAAKTLNELVDLQTTLFKSQLDRLLRQGGHIADLSTKLMEDALSPLSTSINAAIDKLVKTGR